MNEVYPSSTHVKLASPDELEVTLERIPFESFIITVAPLRGELLKSTTVTVI